MGRLTCLHCDRTIPPDSIQADGAFCPYCGNKQGNGDDVPAQVGRVAGVIDLPASPIEEVSFSLRESIGRYVGSVIVINTMMASAIGGIAALIFLSLALAGQVPVIAVPLGAAMLFVTGWAFTSIVSVPMMLYFTLFLRSRRIEAEGTLLHLQIGRKQKTVDLAEHGWRRCGRVATDFYGSYFWIRPELKVMSDSVEFAFGFDEETEAEWIEYFEALGIKEKPKVRWRRVLVNSLLVSFIGGAAGMLVEPLFEMPKGLRGSVIFTGFLDGFLAALFYQWSEARRKLGSNRFLCAATMALLFVGIGLKAGGPFSWQVYSVNGVVGAVMGWFVWQNEEAV